MNGPPDDPRWDWVNISTYDHPNQWIKGECRHQTPEPVTVKDPLDPDSLPILVAWWCPDCDHQFEPDRFSWETDPFAEDSDPAPWSRWPVIPEPNGFERWLGLHLTSSPGAEWWRQLPEGTSERDVATINNKPVKVNQDGVLVYANREPVYVAGGFIRPAPPQRPSWDRALVSYSRASVKVWENLKDALGMSPALFLFCVVLFVIGMASL